MTYVAPNTVVAGDSYPASSHNVIVNDIIDHESRIVAISSNVSAVSANVNAVSANVSAVSASVSAISASALPLTMTIALSDEVSPITTGTGKVTMRAPFAMTLTAIPRASLATASTSGNPTVDINEDGTSILGTDKLSIDANEKTSTTATTPTTLADTAIADDAEITFDIDTAGTGAKGLKVTLYFVKA